MGLVDLEHFAGQDLERVYLAARLPEATKRVERILSEGGVDYTVEIEPFQSRAYEGVAFYVLSH